MARAVALDLLEVVRLSLGEALEELRRHGHLALVARLAIVYEHVAVELRAGTRLVHDVDDEGSNLLYSQAISTSPRPRWAKVMVEPRAPASSTGAFL